MGHYYDESGNPRHTYQNDKGKIIPMRFPQVAKENLSPSTSTVIKDTLAAEWKIRYVKRLVAEAAWANPNYDGCGTQQDGRKDEWIEEVLEASEANNEAADLGTEIHASIANHLLGTQPAKEHSSYIECVQRFISENHVEVLKVEHTFCDKDYGYGGTIDLACKVNGLCCVVDWKSTKTTPGKKIDRREEHPLQIAAYAQAYFGLLSGDEPIGCNVYLSTTEPGRMDVCWYSAEELRHEFTKFSHLLSYWQMAREYYPHKNLKRETK